VSDEDRWTWLQVEDASCGSHVVLQGRHWRLDHGHFVSLSGEPVMDLAPAGTVGESAMNDDHVLDRGRVRPLSMDEHESQYAAGTK
jgi:hypothetical protein